MNGKEMDNSLIGKKIIETAVNLDESLVEILRMEVKRMKQLAKSDIAANEFQKTNNIIRNIIIALLITDEKIKTGIDLYMNNSKT